MCRLTKNMIAKMDDDDAVIERLIQEELDALDENNLDSDHDSDEDNTVEDSDEVEEQEKVKQTIAVLRKSFHY